MKGVCVIMSRLSVLLLLVFVGLESTYASSMVNLFEVESVYIDQLQSYIETTQKKHDEIKRWLRYSAYKLVLLLLYIFEQISRLRGYFAR